MAANSLGIFPKPNMADFLDPSCCRCANCSCSFDLFSRVKQPVVGFLSGLLFSIGWWIWIDAVVVSNVNNYSVQLKFEDWICAILGTLALIAFNLLDKSIVSSDSYYGDGVMWKARLYAFVCLFIAMGSLGGSITILAVKYGREGFPNNWPGIASVIQNFLIFFGSMVLWFFRGRGDDW